VILPACIATVIGTLMLAPPGSAGSSSKLVPKLGHGSFAQQHALQAARRAAREGENNPLLQAALAESVPRTAPLGYTTPLMARGLAAGIRHAASLPSVGGSWKELTDGTYQNDSPHYRDPVWSNSGAGWFLVSGRMTAMAASHGTIWAGGADGGVWRSTDQGRHWTSYSRGLPRLSVGSLAVDPNDHSVWVGLGEPNTSQDSTKAQGVYRLAKGATKWHRVGGDELSSNTIYRVRFVGDTVFAATNRGLYRRATDVGIHSPWHLVLRPDDNPPYDTSPVTDVIREPGSGGKGIVAVIGWRGGTEPSDTQANGFYVSSNAGKAGSFQEVTPAGIDPTKIGRTTLSSSGGHLFAIIESTANLQLLGVFDSPTGDPAGPWTLIADTAELAASGSALPPIGLNPGVQAWYDQYILADPADPQHIYLFLEEVFETTDGGATWKAIGPYWNFTLPCYHGGLHDCPPTTHPDQHGAVLSKGDLYVGNDGGVWHRPMTDHDVPGWVNTNRTLHTLQYYYAGVGPVTGGDAVWGGMQDNGEGLLLPGKKQMVSPFGGDGGDTFVDPKDGTNALNEYVNLDIILTTNGGKTDGSPPAYREVSPSCFAFTYTPDPCDPQARFIAPYRADVRNPTHWVAGGEFVWEDTAGWNTTCSSSSCDWKQVHDTGDTHSITALAMAGHTIYAAWCGPYNSCNPGTGLGPFESGIDTNYGGSWRRLHTGGLPNRYITNLAIDKRNPAHLYVVFGAFSRRWLPGGGASGHVFETRNGGDSWRDISGNLPDAPFDDILIWRHKLVAASDVGVFVAKRSSPRQWSRLGSGLPAATVWDVAPAPSGDYIVAATHGRGLWKIGYPGA
jgi:photosystem II stability/assembly factor-like uncharacterized protein